ncbi:hypothetical protein [Capnocytophaga cynodegmi]|uniref:hypothetical protein n=1 Tax=Capnocytophaga cynodegmi TaxID=28189 RepID=UPI001AC49C06|nr:hypothetical protein [Capnocytophaga cynodegmi]GIM54274.1 hypothetical protein CAPN005_09210 [Capnocytophaga cynodegmi]
MNRRKIYITPEQYQFYLQTGFPYEGYVIGLGYAYIEYQQIPYRRVLNKEQVNQLSQMGFSKICKLQKLDASDKAILESYGKNMEYFKLEKLIQEHNDRYLINTGNGKIVEASKNSNIQIKIKDGDEYGILIKDLSTLSEHQVIGKTKDLVQYANLDKESSSTLSKIQMGVGVASVGQGIYEHIIHQPERYIPKKGVNAGKRTDVFKRTSDNKLRYKFNIKKPENVKFVSKAARAHYQKGLKIRGAGKVLGWGGILLIPIQSYHRGYVTMKDGIDVIVGLIGIYCGPIGWGIASMYFFLDVIGAFEPVEYIQTNPEEHYRNLLKQERDKTYVAPRYNEFDMRKLQEHMQEDNIVKKLIKGNGKKEDFPQFRQGYKDR